MRDTDILGQMNDRYREDRRQELIASGENAAKIEKIIDQEIRARREAVQNQAESEGVRGPNDRRSGMSGLLLGGAVIGVGSAVSNFLNPEAMLFLQAGAQAGIQSGTQTIGIGIGIISELNSLADSVKDTSTMMGQLKVAGFKAASNLATLGTVLFTAYNITTQVFNAMQDFEEKLLSDKIKIGIDAVASEFDRFKDDLDKIDIARLNATLITATQNFEKSINFIANKGRLTFTNFFAWLTGQLSEQELGQISEIERISGKAAADRALSGREVDFNAEFSAIIPQLALEQAAAARSLADSILQTIELRLQRGETTEDITSGVEFAAFAETIATVDAEIRKLILNLENSGLDQATANINARRQEIIQEYAAETIRLKELAIAREKELNAAIRFANVFTASLQRSLNNFNQALNATTLFLDSLDRSVRLVTDSYQGQSKVLKTTIETIKVLQNPQAFGSAETGNAASQAAGFFSGSILGNLVQPLLQSGSLIEETIMSTINDVLANNAEAANELIESKISTNVIAALKGLGLPPELVQNLGDQVGRAITKLRGTPGSSDQISFSELQDEVAGLSQTLSFAKSVQAAAVTALQTFNTALNVYENNVNKIIEAQLSSNSKLRAAQNIVIDASADLAKALGKSTSLEEARQRFQSRLTKFDTDQSTPRGLFNEIKRLGDDIARNDSVRQGAAGRGPAGVDDFSRVY